MTLCVIGFGILLTGCLSSSETVPLSEKHQPSGLNSHFQFETLSSFDDYQQQSRRIIAKARIDLEGKERQQIIDGNAPFDLKPPETCLPGERKPYRRGILLTHGLTGSPYAMKPLAQFFQENCFRVMALLLPGHGTRPGDLLNVTWKDWVLAEEWGIDALSSEVDELYLLGFSAGGALSLYSSFHDQRVKGLFLFAPAIKITSWAALANLHKLYSWAIPRGQWSNILSDESPFLYQSFALNAAYQTHLLTRELRLSSYAVTIPVFMAVSEDDATVDTSASVAFFQQAKHPLNRMIFYRSKGGDSLTRTDKIEIVNSRFPEQHIISSAHTAIMVPPNEPHYGKQGDYTYCMHYAHAANRKPEAYLRCENKREDFLGEISNENMKRGVIRRLMYNPNYDAMTVSLKQFIDALPAPANQ
jgi:esterase/lipase